MLSIHLKMALRSEASVKTVTNIIYKNLEEQDNVNEETRIRVMLIKKLFKRDLMSSNDTVPVKATRALQKRIAA